LTLDTACLLLDFVQYTITTLKDAHN